MNKIEIANLTEIMRLGFKHVCLNYWDLNQFASIPINRKNFYPLKYAGYGKTGIFNNTQTMCWTFDIDPCTIKISESYPKDQHTGWATEAISFKDPDSPMKIYKTMKMKAFW